MTDGTRRRTVHAARRWQGLLSSAQDSLLKGRSSGDWKRPRPQGCWPVLDVPRIYSWSSAFSNDRDAVGQGLFHVILISRGKGDRGSLKRKVLMIIMRVITSEGGNDTALQ